MNPEFLREGSALEDALEPDRLVIGALNKRSADVLRAVYRGVKGRRLVTDLWTARFASRKVRRRYVEVHLSVDLQRKASSWASRRRDGRGTAPSAGGPSSGSGPSWAASGSPWTRPWGTRPMGTGRSPRGSRPSAACHGEGGRPSRLEADGPPATPGP